MTALPGYWSKDDPMGVRPVDSVAKSPYTVPSEGKQPFSALALALQNNPIKLNISPIVGEMARTISQLSASATRFQSVIDTTSYEHYVLPEIHPITNALQEKCNLLQQEVERLQNELAKHERLDTVTHKNVSERVAKIEDMFRQDEDEMEELN